MLIGRERELERLACALDRDEPMLVLGEAGVGKTALLREAGRRSGRSVYEGGALASLSWQSFLPLMRALGRRLSERDPDDVAAAVAETVDGGLLFLDDLQWADAATLRVLVLLRGRVSLVTSSRAGDSGTGAAVRAAKEAGMGILQLEGLADDEGAALLAARRPDLAASQTQEIIRLARGNPLLLEELSAGGEPSRTLQLSLRARLARCSPQAREAMTLLALLGRPAEPVLLGSGAGELESAGLVVREGDYLAVRHALLAEAAADEVNKRERVACHSRLAALITDHGEAARHHEAAGELDAALAKARRAAVEASTPGERARHLGVAARCARGAEADDLRLAAANSLIDAGEHSEAELLVDLVESRDPARLAQAHLNRGRARFGLADPDTALRELRGGLALVDSRDPRTQVRLLVELARVKAWIRAGWSPAAGADADDGESAAEAARRAVKLAEALGERARALAALGLARFSAGEAPVDDLRAAVGAAREEGDLQLELEMALHLESALHGAGDPDGCIAMCREMAERARSVGYRSAEVDFRWAGARAAYLAHGSHEAVEQLAACFRSPALRRASAVLVAGDLAVALGDLGRDEEARLLHDDWKELAVRTTIGSQFAEVEWLAGRSANARRVLDEAGSTVKTGWQAEHAALVGWCLLDLGEPPPPLRREARGTTWGGAFELECEALSLLGEGKPAEAQDVFDKAAGGFAGVLLRNELRCRLGAGIAALRGGEQESARRRLLELERRCIHHGQVALLRRVRTALRAAGVPRKAVQAKGAGTLSGRELETLLLVAEGLTSGEIAGRLGIRRSTVESTIRSAMQKLGARTRAQAAAAARSVAA